MSGFSYYIKYITWISRLMSLSFHLNVLWEFSTWAPCVSAVRRSHSSGDKRWPHVLQRASSWITLILDIWVAASWLFTRRWCNTLTLWVQSDLRLFHSGHIFFFFLRSHGHGMFSGWFQENLFNNSPQMCFFVSPPTAMRKLENWILSSTVWFSHN